MRDLDQEARNAAISADTFIKLTKELDARHTERMKKIVAQYGWPGKSLVGADGASAAWLLVQHAPDHKFMENCLVLMQAAAEQREVSRSDLALLIDRVRIHQGRPQLYGSQFKDGPDGTLVPEPIEDEGHVEERRKSVGLPTMSEYTRIIRQVYARPNPPPK